MRLTCELDENTKKRDALYAEWEELSQFITDSEL